MNKAKLPPHNIEVEKAVLGALLIDRGALIRIAKDIDSKVFYKNENSLVCESILRLYNNGRKVDLLTVVADLTSNGDLEEVGGAFYLTEITDKVVSSAHIEEHMDMLHNYYMLREQISLFHHKINECYEYKDPTDISIDVSSKLMLLQSDVDSENESTIEQLSINSKNERENSGERKDLIGVSTGIKALDKVILGIKSPDFTVIAGRPSMGKTAVAISMVKEVAKKVPVAIFSLEMSNKQLYNRMLSSESKINSRSIKLNDLTPKEMEFLSYADQSLSKLPVIFNDTAAINIDRFRSLCAIYKHKFGVKVIFVDYIQLMTVSGKSNSNNYARVTEISGKLKRIAKELDLSIIGLAQLSRDVESRPNKRPTLSDLKESGAIEQDADNVIFLWRPEYYGFEEPVHVRSYNRDFVSKNLLLFMVAKCRDGETGNVPANVELSTMTVTDHPDIAYVFDNPEIPF